MVDIKHGEFGHMTNNCYIITDTATGKSALVDCTEDSEQMREFIKDSNIEYILLTHGHFDHIAGCKMVKGLTGAKIAIHSADAPMLNSSRLSLAAFSGGDQNNVNADILLTDGDIIKLGESSIKVLSTPGHSDGSVCFIVDDCLFTGDTLFNCSLGRTDFPSGSPEKMRQSLKKINALEGNYKVYTGHDEISTLDYERENNVDFKILINY